MNDPVNDTKKVIGLLGDLKNIAGDNPDVKEGALQAAESFKTVTTFINNALLPLLAVNWTIKKAKDFFEGGQFEEEMRPRISQIPLENIVEPKVSIAGPALQGLSFSLDEPNIKEMYMNLLANAMNSDKRKVIHPAYAEVIRQLCADEVDILNYYIYNNDNLPIIELRREDNSSSWIGLMRHILDIRSPESNIPVVIEHLDSYVENWIRLGLFTVDYTSSLSDGDLYNWSLLRPEYLAESKKQVEQWPILVCHRGVFCRTPFGREFASAISN